MVNFRIVARAISRILIFEGIFLLLTAGVSFLTDGRQTALIFLYSAIITVVIGALVFTPLRDEEKTYGSREGFIIITSIYLILTLFGTLPFLLGRYTHSFTDAFFESISGFTTTNATTFSNIESLPHGVLFWRSLSQWFGGLVAISLSLYVVPVIKSINIQIPTNEFSGQTTDKIHPKTIGVTKRFIIVYVSLTLIEMIMLIMGKMPAFDAVCHSLSTLSTGGFSTRNEGVAAFTSPYIRTVITLFMFFAGTNISLFYFAAKRNLKKIGQNNEFVIYTLISLIISIIVSVSIYFKTDVRLGTAVSDGFFTVISILTTTGFNVSDYNLWGNFLTVIIIILMFTGGMTGSSSSGLKIIRLLIVAKNSRNEIKKLIHPNAFLPLKIDRKLIPQNNVVNLLVFTALYFMTICAGTLLISLMDYDLISSLSTTVSMLGNIGPGVGTFGPFSDFEGMTNSGKWILSGLMLAGRLELLAVIILFTRSFYKK